MDVLALGLLPATLGRISAKLGQVVGGELLLTASSVDLATQLRDESLGAAQSTVASDSLWTG